MPNSKRERWYWFLGFQYRFPRRRFLWWLLVGSLPSALGAFLIVRDAILPKYYADLRLAEFLPSFYWYWHWYAIFGLIYFIVTLLFVVPVANRITLDRVRERSDEKARRYGARILRGIPTPAAPQFVSVAADPNIIPRVETLPVHRDRNGNIIEGAGGKKSSAIVLRCKNERQSRPPRKVGSMSNVSAQISYTGYGNDTSRMQAEGAVWLSELSEKVDFPLDATHRLIVTVIDGKNENLRLTGVQKRGAALAKKVNETVLKGDLFRVRVVWYADSERDAIADYDYMLDRNGFDLGRPYLITTRLWKADRVTTFVIEGFKYLKQARDGGSITDLDSMDSDTLELQCSIANWASKVSGFLGAHYSPETKSQFLGSTFSPLYVPQPGTLQQRLRIGQESEEHVYAKLERQINMLDRLDRE